MAGRYALYYVPAPGSLEHDLLTPLMGYDIASGKAVPQNAPDNVPGELWQTLTRIPAKYGVHATLKAPFELAAPCDVQDLTRKIAEFLPRFAPFCTEPLTLRYFGEEDKGFFALTPEKGCAPLSRLERACVAETDELRAPLSPEDIARRGELVPRQKEYLLRWGYHRVFEYFTFHITITGAVPDPELRARVAASLNARLAPLIGRPLTIDAIALCAQSSREMPFTLCDFFPFTSSQEFCHDATSTGYASARAGA